LEFCGDGVTQAGLGEECDDGNTTDFDGCSGVCRVDDGFELYGTARGGSVSVTVEGVLVSVTTSSGETAAQVIAALAVAINTDVTLSGLGVSALANGNALTVGGTIDNLVVGDPGLTDVPRVPSLSGMAMVLCAALLSLAGATVLRKKRQPVASI
jgi:cysteine-rich repeat protein